MLNLSAPQLQQQFLDEAPKTAYTVNQMHSAGFARELGRDRWVMSPSGSREAMNVREAAETARWTARNKNPFAKKRYQTI